MDLALPHVVVWTTGPGLGTELVAALAAYPIEVSEVRGVIEAQRAATGRTPNLVVLVCSRDPRARIAEAAVEFPGVPMLLFSQMPGPPGRFTAPDGWPVEERPADQAIQEICWQVIEGLARSVRDSDPFERRLGPMLIELDPTGVIGKGYDVSDCWFFPGPFPTTGGSMLPFVLESDRGTFLQQLERSSDGPSFFPLRLLDRAGSAHPVYAGVRGMDAGKRLLMLQPLIDAAPIVGRRRGTRDPLTGLLDRWELWRQLQTVAEMRRAVVVILVRLDEFEDAARKLNFRQMDELFDRLASAITQVFPWPAAPSRLTGGSFLLLVRELSMARIKARVERLLKMVARIDVPASLARSRFTLSVAISRVREWDPDLAVRLAEVEVKAMSAAGGDRVSVVASRRMGRTRSADLRSALDADAWDLRLQPVVRVSDRQPEFYEVLARFGPHANERVSRPEFFATGRLDGLLHRFDQQVCDRTLALLEAHPGLTLSVNLTRETFVGDGFPQSLIDAVRDRGIAPERIIVEILPVCLTLPADVARRRLRQLDLAGFVVALDDFGSGVCNLRHLTDFPLAIVKLDEMVTFYAGDDPLQRNFVRVVVNLCRARGIRTVAEFARTPVQVERLMEDGVDLFQGELFGMPGPVAEMLQNPLPPDAP